MKIPFLILILIFATILSCNRQDNVAYKNPNLSNEERVNDLVARMTLEEKVAQLLCTTDKGKIWDSTYKFSEVKASMFMKNGWGQIGFGAGDPLSTKELAIFINQIQKFLIEKTRLGIPAFIHGEAVHGIAPGNGNSYPSPLALAGMWNDSLWELIFTKVAEEARTRGINHVLSPNLDIARDPRWGRVEETWGEDPYLSSRMAVSIIRGFQGRDKNKIDNRHVAATLKHFAGHGWPESGMNIGPANIDERTLREVILPPFKAAVIQAYAASVMASYNEVNAVPSHINKYLLKEILRKEWGFDGMVVSDYGGIDELLGIHHVVADTTDAVIKTLSAGVDMELPQAEFYLHLVQMVEEGKIEESLVDQAVRNVLRIKFKLGLFDQPYSDPDEAEKLAESHRDLTLKSAQEAIVLLKNENNMLPLEKSKIKRIAVIGPNADQCIIGGYSGNPKNRVTPLQGIRERAGDGIEVLYSEGCRILKEAISYDAEIELETPEANRKRISEALISAKRSDIIVLCLGGNQHTNRESFPPKWKHKGDQADIELLGEQNELVKAMLSTGKPVVVFLFSGPPLAFEYIKENVPAIAECWYLGQETGYAVADLLFGKINPSGKLTISIPRSVGHIPAHYNYKPSARRGYLFGDSSALYPFGFGLSFTSFAFDNLRLSRNEIKTSGSVSVSIDVANTGKRPGAEVVQLYIRDKVSSVTRPVKELKGFKKIWLEPGQKQTVSFSITPESLSFYDINMKYIVEPGDFDLMVGNSSVSYQTIPLTVL
jgi:beta-glucosidase